MQNRKIIKGRALIGRNGKEEKRRGGEGRGGKRRGREGKGKDGNGKEEGMTSRELMRSGRKNMKTTTESDFREGLSRNELDQGQQEKQITNHRGMNKQAQQTKQKRH